MRTYRTYATERNAQRYADKLSALRDAGQGPGPYLVPGQGYTFKPCPEQWDFRYAVGMYDANGRFCAYCA